MEVAAMLNGRRSDLLCVHGNCDSEVDQMVLELPIFADYAILSLGRRLVFVTHGHIHNTDALPPLNKGDILLHGHTHVPAWEECGMENFYLNPGSAALPKEGTPHGYLILTEEAAVWKTMEGKTYHTLAL